MPLASLFMNDMAKANIFLVMVIIDFALYFLQSWVFADMEVRDECADFMGSLLSLKVLNLFHHSGPNMKGPQSVRHAKLP